MFTLGLTLFTSGLTYYNARTSQSQLGGASLWGLPFKGAQALWKYSTGKDQHTDLTSLDALAGEVAHIYFNNPANSYFTQKAGVAFTKFAVNVYVTREVIHTIEELAKIEKARNEALTLWDQSKALGRGPWNRRTLRALAANLSSMTSHTKTMTASKFSYLRHKANASITLWGGVSFNENCHAELLKSSKFIYTALTDQSNEVYQYFERNKTAFEKETAEVTFGNAVDLKVNVYRLRKKAIRLKNLQEAVTRPVTATAAAVQQIAPLLANMPRTVVGPAVRSVLSTVIKPFVSRIFPTLTREPTVSPHMFPGVPRWTVPLITRAVTVQMRFQSLQQNFSDAFEALKTSREKKGKAIPVTGGIFGASFLARRPGMGFPQIKTRSAPSQ